MSHGELSLQNLPCLIGVDQIIWMDYFFVGLYVISDLSLNK
jgi:hypothetical protein